MEDNRRNRIVINLDDRAQAKTRATVGQQRRWPRVLAILGITALLLAVIAAAGIFFWWQHYQTKPAYSLALLIDAAQRNDTATVNQFLDTQKIVTSLTSQVTDSAAGRYGVELDPAARGRVAAFLTNPGPSVQQTIQEEMAKRMAELAQQSEGKPVWVVALTLPYVMKITTEGDVAQVVVTAPGRTAELTMARSGERWQVTSVKDDAVVKQIIDKVMANLPPVSPPPGIPPGRNPGRSPGSATRRRR